ncbi:MAG: squalene/phytoene synthase family protein [Actinomycetota bacterium]|nr:squalene/phytoene synthase family protein [Actinomycetota bacterium]
MSSIPFSIRRIWLLIRGTLVDRDRPHFGRLGSIEDPDTFVWAILPHAARSFAPSILLLPEDEARASAVGYLYARMLDTYEDLSSTPTEARDALDAFAKRFDTAMPGPAPIAPAPDDPDARDLTHLLLIDRHHLVDEVFFELEDDTRERVGRLIRDMATGMIEFSGIFEAQGGVLEDEQQVLDYCHRVIGLPALFVMETLLGDLSGNHRADALEVSELIQLANITRDVEKDLRRGIAYHPALKEHLASEVETATADAVARARRDLMFLATRRAASFRRLVDAVELPRLSPARGAAVLMMLFTARHYRNCALEVGLNPRSSGSRVSTMVLSAFRAAISPWWADSVLLRVERDLLETG